MSDVYQSKDNWKTTNNDTDKYISLYMCVNKAIKKREFTFCGPATGPDSERTSTASECETLWTSTNKKNHPVTQKWPFWTGQAAVKKSSHKAKSQLKAFQASIHLKASFVLRLLHLTCSQIVQK